ncbi:vacuolar protein sorting-associated protein 54 [Diplogelasinospora grovesii]|uniref:Vacuolar protein sorting-associated protein 54 n=1 Tax=Diplogelasinospora grovesii TaxID=303347 RepID=A0AAN6NJW0_9PEZI|nr:vacuolar protein sorting-associated protein 54 [Diplogelasinospora grovesii]
MLSNTGARKSVDSLSPTTPIGPRGDFPFHRKASHSPHRPPPHTHQRRESTASSIHSVGGSLDTSSGSWATTVLETGQNAISTLLQPPIVRTGLLPHTAAPASSAHRPPTSRDIPPVTLTNIPHVDPSEFKPYLSQVGPLFEQLRRIQASEEEASNRQNSRGDDTSEAPDEGHLRPGRRPGASRRTSTASISSLASLEAPSPARRSGSGYRRAVAQGPPPLSTIPTVYFDDDFHLENPRTFDVVSERSEVVRPVPGADEKAATSNGHTAAPRKALATNAILQEKLSWYMDTVEMHLIQSISTASTTFFTALGSLRELHSEAAESVDRIKALRKELEALDEEIATRGLEIVQQRQRQENLRQLHDAVMQLREIVDGVAVCESLVDSGEVESALENIDSLEMLIAGEEGASHGGRPGMRLRDLRGATALQGVSTDLDTLRLRIGKVYESRFISVLVGDLRRHVEQVSAQEVLMRWSSASARARGSHSREPSAFPSYLTSTKELRTDLLPSLTGLQRAKYLTAAASAYRESVLREIRNIIRRPLPSSNDDDNESMMSSSTITGGRQRSQQEKSSVLARNLRALEPKDAEALLVQIYIGVAEILRRLGTQVKVLLDVASSIGDPSGLVAGMKSPPLKSPPFSPTARGLSDAGLEAQEEIHRALDVANLVGQAVDIAHDKIVKLLRVRSEQSTHLELVWFLRYFTLNLHFANECEAISGRSGTTLKTVVNGHIKDFVKQHGDAEKQKLAQGMESDQWNARDFTDGDTELLNQILEGSTRDSAAWAETTKIWFPHPDEDDELQKEPADDATQTNSASKAKTRSAVIEEDSFLLPNSALLCMNGMAQFLHLIVGIPSMTADISTSLIGYLMLFNSRCTQLILGAGATKSAGLKNITTKHLALASQALAFIATIIPHVREFVRRHCTSGSGPAVSTVMGEFDRVRRLYQEHQNSIYDKLIEIMNGRALMSAKKMKAVDWDAPDGGQVHEYMETLAKETTTLHRNLTKHLPEGTVRMIMTPVFRSYKDTFGAGFRAVEARTEAGRDSMLRDIELFESRLGKIDGFEDAGEYLRSIIKNRLGKIDGSEDTGEYLRSIIKSKEIKQSAPAQQPQLQPPTPAAEERKGEILAAQVASPVERNGGSAGT